MAAIFNAQLSEFGSHYKVVNVILSEANISYKCKIHSITK
jgi:hypothetical protein